MSVAPLMGAVVAFLTADGWPLEIVEGPRPTVTTRFASGDDEWTCTVTSFEEQGQLVFDSTVPVDVPVEQREVVDRLLSIANWDLLTGAFALDPEGAARRPVRFRTSIVLPDGEPLTFGAAKCVAYANVLTVGRFLDVLRGTAGGALDLDAAIAHLPR